MAINRYQYYVEGKCEEKLINVLKEQRNMIIAGKVEVFNAKQQLFSSMRLRVLNEGTTVVLVFDSDTNDVNILKSNLEMLRNDPHVKTIWCVIQVENLEDELKRSTDINEERELTDSTSNKNFKHDFIMVKNLYERLKKHHFDYSKIWVTKPSSAYNGIENAGLKIKR